MNTSKKSVAEIAYELWEARGRPDGSSEQDWLEAERLAAHARELTPSRPPSPDEASLESFPASDPPASHTPDVPPSNADEKWAAARRAKSGRNPG